MLWAGRKAIYIKLNMEKHGNKLRVFKVDTFFLLIFCKNRKTVFTNVFMKCILSHVVVKD